MHTRIDPLDDLLCQPSRMALTPAGSSSNQKEGLVDRSLRRQKQYFQYNSCRLLQNCVGGVAPSSGPIESYSDVFKLITVGITYILIYGNRHVPARLGRGCK
jgi:hypothetical protein